LHQDEIIDGFLTISFDLFSLDMAPTTSAKSAVASKVKKEKLFHPASRKAGQLARHALRKGKLGNLATKRNQKHHSLGVSLCQSSILNKK
jgi:hypothetical protein